MGLGRKEEMVKRMVLEKMVAGRDGQRRSWRLMSTVKVEGDNGSKRSARVVWVVWFGREEVNNAI